MQKVLMARKGSKLAPGQCTCAYNPRSKTRVKVCNIPGVGARIRGKC